MADNEAIRVKLQSVLNEFAFVSAADMMRSLADAGLHLVTDAAKRVLDAMGAVDTVSLRLLCRGEGAIQHLWLRVACEDELARRGEKA